jgi:hypothetical protein
VLEGKQDVVYRPEKNTATETRLGPVNVTRTIPADESLVLNAAVENTISRYGLSPAWPSSSTINISNHNQGTSVTEVKQPEHPESKKLASPGRMWNQKQMMTLPETMGT